VRQFTSTPENAPRERDRYRIIRFRLILVLACLISMGVALLREPSSKASANVAQSGGLSEDNIWQYVEEDSITSSAVRAIIPQAYRTARLNQDRLKRLLARAPIEFTEQAKQNSELVLLPMPDGTFARFTIEESPIMEMELAAQFPEIKTYRGQGIDDPTATTRFDWTPTGFHAIVLSSSGTTYIDPYSDGDTANYITYAKRDYSRPDKEFVCLFDQENPALPESNNAPAPTFVSGSTLRTYRLALAATGEYTQAAGGTVPLALARMTTSTNRVNGIYEREVSVRMLLVANETLIIYINGATDPYTNNNGSTMLGQNQTNLDAVIGNANYDIGHVFSTGGGGVASLGVPCRAGLKARGVTGLPNPVGDGFDVDYVAHEMGHQYGAVHTFNGTTDNCGGGNRSASSAYEPGSGSTIMAYAGICGAQNLQPHSEDYFHSQSLIEIINYITGPNGNSCPVQTSTGNTPPTVNAGANFTIPTGTPFTLTATATDPNNPTLTYCWEEFDLGPSSPPDTDADGQSRPILRSYLPSSSPSRTFPRLTYVLNNNNQPPSSYSCSTGNCLTGEVLPSINRVMGFQVTARDNNAGGGGVNSGIVQVTVNASSGPFGITNPNTSVSWAGGTAQTVTWNVAGTSGAPVNASNVKIWLSTDGGNTFPATLAATTPNDGSESVTVPNVATTQARVKVEAVGNVFFDISNTNFTITSTTPSYQGFLDAAGCGIITGWAWDANLPNTIINVDIYDGATLISSTPANLSREDLVNAGIGNGFHGFSFTVPQSLKDGQTHTIRARFAGTVTELINSPRTINCSGAPPLYQGYHDAAGCNTIAGWAWDANDPNNPINVDIYDGATLIATVPSIQFRPDLVTAGIGNGFHGFSYTVPASLQDGQPHSIRVKFPGTNTDLSNTPRTIACSGAPPLYQGYHDVADCNVISGWAWDANDPNQPISVAIYANGQLTATVLAIQFRQGLVNVGIGNGYHAFVFNTPASLKNGQPHSILVRYSGSATALTNSPKTITCASP
jgi:reprolysin-like metallo-peptidase family M12B